MRRQERGVKILVARTVTGHYVVMTTNSACVAYDCENVSYSSDDIGLGEVPDDMDEAILLWEGGWKLQSSGAPDADEPDVVYSGAYRTVALEELPSLLGMIPPEPEDGDDAPVLAEPSVVGEIATILCTFDHMTSRDNAIEFVEKFPGARLVFFESGSWALTTGRVEVPKRRAGEFLAYADCDEIILKAEIT